MISATLTATPKRRAKPRKWTDTTFAVALEYWKSHGTFNEDLYRKIQIKKAQSNNFII